MISVFNAAADLEAFCAKNDWPHCFIGGLAAQRWGEPRFTKDADATIYTGFGKEEKFIQPLLREFDARIPDAAQFAIEKRILLLFSSESVGIDVALGGLPFEKNMVERASPFTYPPECTLTTCSAEDLVITKAFSGRERDWLDLEPILIRQQGQLDWKLIERELKQLVKAIESPDHLARLRRLREKVQNYDD